VSIAPPFPRENARSYRFTAAQPIGPRPPGGVYASGEGKLRGRPYSVFATIKDRLPCAAVWTGFAPPGTFNLSFDRIA